MSKIGKKFILIPQDVEVKINGDSISTKGPKGDLTKNIPGGITVKVEGNKVYVSAEKETESRIWGLARSIVNNMIKGVSVGFEKSLEFSGVGYKAQLKGKDLELSLGFTHPVSVKAQDGIVFQVEKNVIKVSGVDKETVGHAAAAIRAARPPEPYKGSGVKYLGEVIQRKAGKKAVTGA